MSYAFDSRGLKVTQGREVEFGEPFSEGDIISCYAVSNLRNPFKHLEAESVDSAIADDGIYLSVLSDPKKQYSLCVSLMPIETQLRDEVCNANVTCIILYYTALHVPGLEPATSRTTHCESSVPVSELKH